MGGGGGGGAAVIYYSFHVVGAGTRVATIAAEHMYGIKHAVMCTTAGVKLMSSSTLDHIRFMGDRFPVTIWFVS